jgi:hypothetical protein
VIAGVFNRLAASLVLLMRFAIVVFAVLGGFAILLDSRT